MQFPGFKHRLHLDFETYSEADLPRTGAHVYAMHPSTEALMLAYALDDAPVQQWQPAEAPMPDDLRDWLADETVACVAFNAAFERLILRHVLKINVPVERWRCTMVCAYYLGFSGGLDSVLSQTPLGITKDPRGGRLIHLFSKPAPKNHHANRYTEANRPAEWREFLSYNRQDVEVERKLLLWLAQFPMMPEWDWARYQADQAINDRGIYADGAMAEGAMRIWQQERERITEAMRRVTGLAKVTRMPFLVWLDSRGIRPPTMGKDDLLPFTKDPGVPDDVKAAIQLWVLKESKAVTKYSAILRGIGEHDRVRGMFQFKGASRTDRTAGRRLQLQNLRRSVETRERAKANVVDAIRTGDVNMLQMISNEAPAAALGSSIRHAIQAAPGCVLAVADLTSIESVVLGWLTYCQAISDTFESGRDTYKEFACRYFHVDYDAVTPEQRKFSKPPVLGAGFMLGWRGLVAYAEGYGVTLTEEEARRAVDTFRTMYPEIPLFWDWIVKAVIYVIQTRQVAEGYRLRIERDDHFLRIWLPSGRALSYYQPEVQLRSPPWAETSTPLAVPEGECPSMVVRKAYPHLNDEELAEKGLLSSSDWVRSISYMGTNLTGQWVRTHAHAGLFTENIVQSIAMDVLFDGITRAESRRHIPVVLQVHDELGVEVPEDRGEEALSALISCMTTRPTWAPDLWLGAKGYVSRYYMKD